MIAQLTRFCLAIADPVLGWLLRLPWELAVLIVALAVLDLQEERANARRR